MLNSCKAQKDFIRQSIAHNLRIDGRSNSTVRTPIVKTNVINHLAGSSYVYMEYENIEIYTGIKIKVEQIRENQKGNSIFLQLSSMRKLEDSERDELMKIESILQAYVIEKLRNNCEQIRNLLTIKDSKKHYLQLYIDIFLLSSPHISQLQLLIIGIISALNSIHVAEIEVSYNQVTEQQTVDVTKIIKAFKKQKWEQTIIVGIVEEEGGRCVHFVLDLKREQYESVDACLLIILEGEKVKLMESLKGKISVETINKCAKFVLTKFKR